MNGVAPDLIVYFGDLAWRSVGTVGGDEGIHTFENDTGPDDANHAQDGLLIMAGPGIEAGPVDGMHLLDVAPTVLELLGIEVPESMRGRSLAQQLSLGRFFPPGSRARRGDGDRGALPRPEPGRGVAALDLGAQQRPPVAGRPAERDPAAEARRLRRDRVPAVGVRGAFVERHAGRSLRRAQPGADRDRAPDLGGPRGRGDREQRLERDDDGRGADLAAGDRGAQLRAQLEPHGLRRTSRPRRSRPWRAAARLVSPLSRCSIRTGSARACSRRRSGAPPGRRRPSPCSPSASPSRSR